MPFHTIPVEMYIAGDAVEASIGIDYRITAGSPAHMGSLSYAGHPAEPAEIEIEKAELIVNDKTASPPHLICEAAPKWLIDFLANSDGVYHELGEAADWGEYQGLDPDYERDLRLEDDHSFADPWRRVMAELQMPDEIRNLMASMWADIQGEAKDNPAKYRNSTFMERGKDVRFHYWSVPGLPKGKSIAFCYSKHRNIAGFYLTWTEVWSGRQGYRTNIHGWETKHDAMEYCRTRLADAKKPTAERKFVLPPFKKKGRS